MPCDRLAQTQGLQIMKIVLYATVNALIGVVFTAGCAPMSVPTQPTAPSVNVSQREDDKKSPNRAAPTQGGMTVHIDPVTGRFLSEPTPDSEPLVITPEIENAMSTSSEGLVEQVNPVKGGGVIMDLRGRFQSPLIIHQNTKKEIKIQHLEEIKHTHPKTTGQQ